MNKILTASEMKYCDDARISSGLPSLVLMERAALAVLKVIRENRLDTSKTLILAGNGNNGADGVALARLLAEEGEQPVVLLSGGGSFSEQMKQQLAALECYGVRIAQDDDFSSKSLSVDALFGIGLSRDITGRYAEIIEKANKSPAVKVAVDIPSGISADDGSICGCALKADITVTFAAAKRGHFLYPGKDYTGVLYIEPVGIPIPDIPETGNVRSLGKDDLKKLPGRPADSHKGTFGKLLVVAGSRDICGAAYLSAAAALKTGAGMVMVYTHSRNRTAILSLLPEALVMTYEDREETMRLEDALEWADAAVIGPGLSTGNDSVKLLEHFIEYNTHPAILDADALNILAAEPRLFDKIHFPAVFTPHIGEMSRLMGKPAAEIKKNLIETAVSYAKDKGIACVLKDAATVTAYPDGRAYLNTTGTDALATAGSGDVLSGILGSFLMQYAKNTDAWAAYAVCFHGLAAAETARLYSKSGTTAKLIVDTLASFSSVLD